MTRAADSAELFSGTAEISMKGNLSFTNQKTGWQIESFESVKTNHTERI